MCENLDLQKKVAALIFFQFCWVKNTVFKTFIIKYLQNAFESCRRRLDRLNKSNCKYINKLEGLNYGLRSHCKDYKSFLSLRFSEIKCCLWEGSLDLLTSQSSLVRKHHYYVV